MRRLLLFCALILTAVSACKKEDDDDLSVPYVPPYRVSGVVDFSMQKYSFGAELYEMYVALEYENGEQERVTLSLENVPSGLKDSLFVSSGYPSFSSYITFVDSGVAEGVYTLKLITQGEKSGRREFPFTITILGVPDCTSPLTGAYNNSYSFCTGSGGNYSVNVQPAPSVQNRLVFSNLNNNGLQLYADVNCSSSSPQINVPSQTVNGVTYSGYGYTFTNGQGQSGIYLNVYQSSGGSSNNCNYQLAR